MSIRHWVERALIRTGFMLPGKVYVTVQITCLLPLVNCSGVHMVVSFPRHRRAWAVAYSREIATFQAGIHAAQRGERRN